MNTSIFLISIALLLVLAYSISTHMRLYDIESRVLSLEDNSK